MPGVQNQLIFDNIARPHMLPNIFVTVKVGQTIDISRSMIDTATGYAQNQNIAIGKIQIITFSSTSYNHLLSQTNNATTLAYFTNSGSRIFYNTNTGYNNQIIQKSTIDLNNFKVTGVKIGQAAVVFKATASNATHESSLSSVSGRIIINVVSAVNNKPSTLKAGTQSVVAGEITAILGATVTHLYADPENDAPHKVRIDALPTRGKLIYLGEDVQVSDEILYSQILAGMLVYWNDDPTTQPGQPDTFTATVSDVGSGLYY